MKKNFVIMCFVSLLPLLANAQFETINDVRYYYSKSKSAYEVVKIPSNQSPDFSGYSGDITVLNYINGKKVTTIDKRAFYWSDITSIKLPLSLTTIGEEAFAGNREITSIEIPQNVEYIHKEAFRYCENLKDIYCYAKCPILGKDVFGKVKGFTLHVPEDYISYYKNADQWKKAKKIIAITIESRAIEAEKEERIELEKLQKEEEQKKAEEAKRAAEEARLRAEAEAKQKAETEARLKAEAEAKQKAEEELNKAIANSPFKNSQYTDEKHWELVYPNGNTLKVNGNNLEIRLKNKQYYFVASRADISKTGAKEVISGTKNLPTISPESDIWFRIGVYNIGSTNTKELDNAIRQSVVPMFNWENGFEYRFCKGSGEYVSDNLGTYKNGKYLSITEEKQSKIAPFIKRFGFDPTKKSIKQLVTAGRDFQLLRDYLIFLNSDGDLKYHSGGKYAINLSIDKGTSKCYDLIKGNTLGGNELFDRVRLCYFWVKNGKISSVSWY